MDSSWDRLMNAPWGKFSEEAKAEKARALKRYADGFEAWKAARIKAGKWLTQRVVWK